MSSSETTAEPRYVTLPWGRARVIDEVIFERSRADGAPVCVGVAHLREADGSDLVRFFYRSNGHTVRGPLTLQAADRLGLKAALAQSPALRKLVRELIS